MDLSEIQREFTIKLPGFAISAISEGPWTVKYRAINDVCNRTFGDPLTGLATTGASKNCSGGEDCVKTGSYSCYDGTFGGIRSVGNDPNNAMSNYTKVNYCASNAATNLDSAVNPAAYSNTRSKLYLDLLYTVLWGDANQPPEGQAGLLFSFIEAETANFFVISVSPLSFFAPLRKLYPCCAYRQNRLLAPPFQGAIRANINHLPATFRDTEPRIFYYAAYQWFVNTEYQNFHSRGML